MAGENGDSGCGIGSGYQKAVAGLRNILLNAKKGVSSQLVFDDIYDY